MKFTSYDPVVNMGVMQNNPVHVSRDIHAYGPQSGGEQWKALGQLATIGLEMHKKVTDGKVMEANNEYNRLMSEGTMELMQRKEQNALNITEDYDKLQQKVLGQVKQKFGAFIGAGPGAEAFNNYTERDNVTRREHMMKYQMGETEKYQETQFNNQLASCQQMVMDGGATDAAIEGAYNRGVGLLQSKYANYGPEKVAEQERIFRGQLVASALQMAVNMGDYARMGALVGKYGSVLDARTRVATLSMLGKRQREAHDLHLANNLVSMYGTQATYEDILKGVQEELASKKGADGLLAYSESLTGKTMRNGRQGCCEAYIEQTAPFLKFSAENRDEVYVPNLFRAALQSNDVTVERFTGQHIPPGSGVIYVEKGDDPDDPEMLAHITMADGNGGYIGNSSGARDYEDENGNQVRGDGCIVHASDQEIDGLEIAWIIKPNDVVAQEMYALDANEIAARRWDLYQKEVSRIKVAERNVIQQAQTEMQDLLNHGVTDVEQYQAIVNKYAYTNGQVNDTIRVDLEKTVAAVERRNERAVEQAAKGRPSVKVDSTFDDFIVYGLSSGQLQSKDAILALCNEAGITDPKEQLKCLKRFDEYLNNKGVFAIDYKTVDAYVPQLADVKGQAKVQMTSTVHELARLEAKKYMAEHNGEMPEDVQLASLVSKAFTENVVTGARTMENSWFGNWLGKPVTISRADLAANGYANAKYLGDGRYMLLKLDGTHADYVNEDEFLAMIGRSGYVEP